MEASTVTAAAPADARTVSAQPYRLRWVVAGVVLAAAVMDLLDATSSTSLDLRSTATSAAALAPCSG
jgi:hypothetical protein